MSDRHPCAVASCDLSTLDVICPRHRLELVTLLMSITSAGSVQLVDRVGNPVRLHRGVELRCDRCAGRLTQEHAEECGGQRWSRVTVEVWPKLGEHPGLWQELQTTITRQAKMGGSASASSGKASERPVPYHARASAVAGRMRHEIGTWAREVAESYPHLTLSARTIPDAARWLAAIPSLLAEHPAAGELYAAVARVVRDAVRVIDREPDKVYAGFCGEPLTDEAIEARERDPDAWAEGCCPGELYAPRGEPFVRCRLCGTKHDAAVRRQWLSDQLSATLVTAAEAAQVLSGILDKDVKVQTIYNWRSKGRLQPARPGGEDHDGTDNAGARVLFRYSEVEALAIDMKTRNTKPRAKASEEGSAA